MVVGLEVEMLVDMMVQNAFLFWCHNRHTDDAKCLTELHIANMKQC